MQKQLSKQSKFCWDFAVATEVTIWNATRLIALLPQSPTIALALHFPPDVALSISSLSCF